MDKNLLQKAKAHMIALINPQALKGRPDHNHGCNPWSVTQAQHRCNPWTVTPRTLLLLLLAIATAAQAQFGGGTGASNNPYLIATTNHLLELAASVNSGNQHEGDHFILLNDLDFTGIDYTPIGGGIINNDYAVFSGTFNGLGHKILNLRVGCSYHAGIFGQISSGTIEHLTLGGDSRIEGGFCVGGIVGRTGTSNIIDCHVEKTVTIAASKRGSEYIGGIVGAAFDGTSYVAQEIEGCTSAATVTNNEYSNVKYVGGIAGVILSDGQSIRNCKNYGAVSGSSDVGGIVGEFNFNWPGNVLEDCYTGGNCTLYGVGQPGSSQGINLEGKAVSMHTITFGDNVQGNVTTTPTATFEGENFYAAGMQVFLNIIPDSGTPVGYLPMFYLNAEPKQTGYEIETVMPAENVTVTVDATNLMRDISYSQWVSVSLNQESFDYDGSEQVPEVTVTDINNGVTLVEGIDYEVISPANPVSPGIYTLTINGIGQFGGKVRVLYAITTPDRWPGLGTADKPYLILTTDHILALADSVNNGKSYIGQYFSLQNDLDFSSKDYVPIGNFNNEFKGTFNGNGHSFNHVVINNDKDYLGLFGNIGEDGSVSGLTLGEGSSIEGRDYIGGIAALCRGTISDCSTAEGVIVKASSLSAGGIAYSLLGGRIANCQNHADVSTKSICGGIAGNNENGEVSGCINYGSVEAGTWIAGGIVGEITQHGIVRDCFNEGTVSSPQNVGGIVGDLGGIIRNCLNLGAVSASNNKNVGGIAGRKTGSLSLSNNYYAGTCNVGGINGSDVAGQAMRGYTIEVGHPLVFSLEGSTGLLYDGKVYAGRNQSVVVALAIPNSTLMPQCFFLNRGTISDNGNGTYTITMPNNNVTVYGNIVESYRMYYEIPCDGSHTATVIYDDSYTTMDYVGIEDFEYMGAQYAVTAIADNVFDGLDNLLGVDCHSNISTIGANAFRNCTGIMSFGFYENATPPTVGEGALDGLTLENLWLMVPFCSQYDYSVHPVWGQFGTIFPQGNCEYNFTNHDGSGDRLWSNPLNWAEGVVPGEGMQVGIFGDCEIDTDVTVGSITIGNYIDEEEGSYERLTVKSGNTLTASNFIYTSGDERSFIIEDGAQVIHPNAGTMATVEKNISAFTPNAKDGWHLVSSPAIESFAPSVDNGFLANEYDLYFYDESAHYWRNYKSNGQYAGFYIAPLEAYLYANSANDILSLTGTLRPSMETVTKPLSYTDGIELAGFNLVGNPFAHNVTTFTGSKVADEVYRMNGTKDNLVVSVIDGDNPLKPGEGFFVKATGDEASITFNSRATNAERSNITLELSENGLIIDRFILKRDGEPLEKLTLRENGTKIYATQDNQDMAVVVIDFVESSICSEAKQSSPVNFKTAKNGTYALTVNVENMDLDYLHLIDNITGADVDLLGDARQGDARHCVSTYTFTAKTTDYASRFRLIFNAEDALAGSASDAPFAYINNGNIVITADARGASLQVVDVMGRVIVSRDGRTRCVSTAGMPVGVYVLRLIDGDSVRTQKIVIP